MLEKIKASLRISANATAFDAELGDIIAAALLDLGLAGVDIPTGETTDALIIRAVTTYVKLNFGTVGEYGDFDKLKRSYDEQKSQLISSTEYGGLNG